MNFTKYVFFSSGVRRDRCIDCSQRITHGSNVYFTNSNDCCSILEKLDFSRFGGSIRSVDGDISELYLISDMHMTDYSSTMFDYAVLHRPQIFYCYDLDTYYRNRGVYMDFEEEAPGPIIKDTDGLIEYLKAPRTGDYEDRYQRFMKKYTHREDGKNSKRIGDLIDKIMKEGEAGKSSK